jgi:predicted transcriptional regulator
MPTSTRQTLLDIAASLSEDATLDDAMDQIYVRQKIQAGLDDAAAGRVVPHEQVFAEFEGNDLEEPAN